MAQQSEKIESGSPGTARSGQQTLQLRDLASHPSAGVSTAQEGAGLSLPAEPPRPPHRCLCPSQTPPKQRVPRPAQQDRHQGQKGAPWLLGPHPSAAPGSLGTGASPQSRGVRACFLVTAQRKEMPPLCIHPRGSNPSTDPPHRCAGCAQLPAAQPAPLQGKICCLGPRTPWAPPNPPAPGFPRLRETFKSGLGSRHVLLISSGRSTRALSRAICSAPRPTTGRGRGTRCLRRHPAPGDTQPKAAGREAAGPGGSTGSCFTQPRGEQDPEFGISPESSFTP